MRFGNFDDTNRIINVVMHEPSKTYILIFSSVKQCFHQTKSCVTVSATSINLYRLSTINQPT